MTTPTDKRATAVRIEFQAYRTTIDKALGQVENHIAAGEYALACRIMAAVSQAQAKASVEMRSTLVRHGFIAREATDE
jgi:hypothetical protein